MLDPFQFNFLFIIVECFLFFICVSSEIGNSNMEVIIVKTTPSHFQVSACMFATLGSLPRCPSVGGATPGDGRLGKNISLDCCHLSRTARAIFYGRKWMKRNTHALLAYNIDFKNPTSLGGRPAFGWFSTWPQFGSLCRASGFFYSPLLAES